jgi:hypothetical protein
MNWDTPFGDLEIGDMAMAACGDTIVVAGKPSHDAFIEVGVARWDGARFVDVRRIPVPHDSESGPVLPSLAFDGRTIALNPADEFGASSGLVVIPDVEQPHYETIPNPVDPDISFAEVIRMRGSVLVTRGAWDVRCYQRGVRGAWTERLTLPSGTDQSVEWGWGLDVSPSGEAVIASRDPGVLVVVERRSRGLEVACELPAQRVARAVAFVDNDLALVGSEPWDDGAMLRLVRRVGPRWSWDLTVPVSGWPAGEQAILSLTVAGGRAGICGRDCAFVLDLATGSVTNVPLPPPAVAPPGWHEPTLPRDPQIVMMGAHAVVRAGNKLRVL